MLRSILSAMGNVKEELLVQVTKGDVDAISAFLSLSEDYFSAMKEDKRKAFVQRILTLLGESLVPSHCRKRDVAVSSLEGVNGLYELFS